MILSFPRYLPVAALSLMISVAASAQKALPVKFEKKTGNHIDIKIGGKLFTSFLYPDTLEKPILYPVYSAGGIMVTRGFPLMPKPGEPDDHPHHMGIWFNYENLNGLDFWNNSYAIKADRKHLYGWIRTDRITEQKDGNPGVLSYHANWTNQQNEVIVEEKTRFEFSGTGNQRIIDRVTTLTAAQDALFKDAKDALLAIRVAKELQIPTKTEKSFTDDKGNATVVKGNAVANGNYLSSEGKLGDSVWSTRGKWVNLFGKMGNDSISIAIIDHPKNINYPTFWHARGYGLFAANPLGENVFTNGKSSKNLQLKKGESVTFRYRIIVNQASKALSPAELNAQAEAFASKSSPE
jgi:methane monooxygenase PmoA-like